MSSSRHGRPLVFLLRVAIFLLVFGVVAEVWFRSVMPACEWPVGYQQRPSTMLRYDPKGPTYGLYTTGRLCRRGGEWRVNNAGWNSGVDYASAAQRRRPMIALVGDSYIEGFLTDTDEHIDAYLPKMLPGTDSYAFGVSGWYLEQYVAVSRYARVRFQPDVLVVFIDELDVRDSSVAPPNLWGIRDVGGKYVEIPPTSAKTYSQERSAVIRYLRFNARLAVPSPRAVRDRIVARLARRGNTLGSEAPQAGEDAGAEAGVSSHEVQAAADFMVGRLCSDHPGTPIVFVAHRQPSYLNGWDTSDRYLPMQDVAHTPLFPDGRAVEAACEGRAQCSFIDLRYAFSRDWAAHHVRFESADGAHWSAYANRVVARTLADVITKSALLSRAPTP